MFNPLAALALVALLPLSSAHAADNSRDWPHAYGQSVDQHSLSGYGLNREQQRTFRQQQDAHWDAMQTHQRHYRNNASRSEQQAFLKQERKLRQRHARELRRILTPEQRIVFDQRLRGKPSKPRQHWQQSHRGHYERGYGTQFRNHGKHCQTPRQQGRGGAKRHSNDGTPRCEQRTYGQPLRRH